MASLRILAHPTATGTTIDLSGPAFQGVTAPIEFRLYGWGGTGASGTFSVNDFTFNGTVDAITVPEPASFTLVMLLGLIPMVSRRRLLR